MRIKTIVILILLTSFILIFGYSNFLNSTGFNNQINQFKREDSYIQNNNSKNTLKLLFVGDIMLDRFVKKKILKNKGDFTFPFAKIKDYLNSFDFVIANLEGPISSRGIKFGSQYSFRMDPLVVKAFKQVNLNVFNLANNHIFDYSLTALEDTIKTLTENNLKFYGVGNKKEVYEPLILEKNNVKIGILGFSDFLKHLKPKENKIGVSVIDENISDYIKKAKEKVDILIVTFHWGEEYQKIHNKRQEEIAKKAISSGADLVVGHHPHVIQDIEVFRDKFIFYSLGNFVFDQNFSKETMEGGLVEVEIDISSKKIKNIYFRKSYLNKNFQIEKISEPLLVYNLNGMPLLLKIADEPKEWEQGLMFVKVCDSLREVSGCLHLGDGMIFLFPDKQIRYFWNKNTFVDLEVYWLDDNKIVGKDLLPSIEKTKEIYTIKSPTPVNKVIEIIIKKRNDKNI